MTIMPSHKSCSDKYPAYKDSGVDWPGEIPDGWETSRLRNVFSFSKGLTITKENLQEEGVYCVNYGEIHSKFGFEVNPEINDLKCVSEEYLISDSNSLLSKGDFVFADTSEDIEGSGNFTYLNSDVRTFAGYHTVIARLKIDVNMRFAAYVLTSQSFRNQVRRRVKGVKVFSITQSLLKTVTFWFPNEKEQTAIANFLDDKTAKIDRAIAQKEQLIVLLKERKQIIIQNAVTKGLDPNVKMKDSGVEWIGEIPEGWGVMRAKYLFREVDERSKEGIEELLSVSHMTGVTPRSEKDVNMFLAADYSGSKLCCQGDVVYNIMWSWMGALGVSSYFGIVSPSYGVYRQRNPMTFNPTFLEFKLKTAEYIEYYNRVSTGLHSSRLRFYSHMFMNMEIAFPKRYEQDTIVAHIKKQSKKIDHAISLQQTQIEKLKEFKATLIDSAVTGKIKVI